jgi:hypothetical protein
MAGMNTIRSAAYEGDIVSRLLNWRGLHLAHSGDLFEEAAAEIERLRSQPCPYVTGTVTQHCTLTPFTLTDEERAALAWGIHRLFMRFRMEGDPVIERDLATLRGLLERTSR